MPREQKISVDQLQNQFMSSNIDIIEVKTKRQNFFLIFEIDQLKLRISVYSRLENQRIWPLVVTATINKARIEARVCILTVRARDGVRGSEGAVVTRITWSSLLLLCV